MQAAVSSSHVVSSAPSSSLLYPAPVWGPYHGQQFFTNCPSVGPFHRVQSLRNRLPQRGSPTRSQALPANLLWWGLLSPRVHRSWQEPAPTRAPHGVTASFRHHPAPAWGPPQAAGGDLLHHGPPWAAGTACLTMVCSMAAGNLCSGAWSTSCPPSALTLVSAQSFSSHSLTPLP